MIKKIYIQLILISILVIISFSLFLKYFKQPNLKNDFNISLGQTTNTDDNLIEDLK